MCNMHNKSRNALDTLHVSVCSPTEETSRQEYFRNSVLKSITLLFCLTGYVQFPRIR